MKKKPKTKKRIVLGVGYLWIWPDWNNKLTRLSLQHNRYNGSDAVPLNIEDLEAVEYRLVVERVD